MTNKQIRDVILDLLIRIEQQKSYSHLLIDQEIKAQSLSSKDERFLTEIVYGTMQRKITLDYYLEPFLNTRKKLAAWVRMLLRMSVYQMVYLDKVPDHAVIHEAVEIAKKRGHKGIASLVNGVLRNVQRKGLRNPATEITHTSKRISVETSHPEWLVRRWLKMYGKDVTEEMCRANLQQKPMAVRIQPLRITREAAKQELLKNGFEVKDSLFSDQGIVIQKGNILQSPLFSSGMVSIQDQSSMLATEMLAVQPGMRILDACSAPGGKTTHIAEKMQNKGVIRAHDLHAKKVQLVDKKAAALQLTIIRTSQADARELKSMYHHESFDRILVDAPCSGLGVIRGKPDIKYNKSAEDIRKLSHVQLDILESVAPLLKKGGYLLYCTCTVDKEENEDVVGTFLQRQTNYKVDKRFFATLPKLLQTSPGMSEMGLQLFPQSFQTDGFFLTRLIRTASY